MGAEPVDIPDEDEMDVTSDDDESALDKMRDTGVGTEDPNIVGDVGPTDIPPGRDPDGGLIVDDPEGAEDAEI